jgi:hypothetical protein
VSPTLAAICFFVVLRFLVYRSLSLSMYPRTGDVFTDVDVECCLLCHGILVYICKYKATLLS